MNEDALSDDLQEWLMADDDDLATLVAQVEGYEGAEIGDTSIGGHEEASRWLRRYHRAGAEIERINALADAEITRVESWRSDRTAGASRFRMWVAGVLERWMRTAYAASKTKTQHLPSGVLRLTKAQQRTRFVDDAAIAAALDADGLGDLVTYVPKISKDDVKKRLVAGQAAPPAAAGVGVVPPAGYEWRVAVNPATGTVIDGVLFEVSTEADRFSIVDAP